jgi:hypothetical protein
MRAIIFLAAVILAGAAMAIDIIPVTTWPMRIGNSIYNPTIDQCVKAGYRLLVVKPSTPSGKRIKSEKIIQDPAALEKCKYEIIYEDIPVVTPPVIVSETLTNIPASRVTFNFSTNGIFRGVVWTDAPKTNTVKE